MSSKIMKNNEENRHRLKIKVRMIEQQIEWSWRINRGKICKILKSEESIFNEGNEERYLISSVKENHKKWENWGIGKVEAWKRS